MQEKRSDQVMPQHIKSSSRASARGSKRAMNSNNEKAIPVLKLKDGQYRLVEASGYNSDYVGRSLLLLNHAHPNTVSAKELENATGYKGGTKQFGNTVISKMLKDGRAAVADNGEVYITPLGRHFVYERWPVLF